MLCEDSATSGFFTLQFSISYFMSSCNVFFGAIWRCWYASPTNREPCDNISFLGLLRASQAQTSLFQEEISSQLFSSSEISLTYSFIKPTNRRSDLKPSPQCIWNQFPHKFTVVAVGVFVCDPFEAGKVQADCFSWMAFEWTTDMSSRGGCLVFTEEPEYFCVGININKKIDITLSDIFNSYCHILFNRNHSNVLSVCVL